MPFENYNKSKEKSSKQTKIRCLKITNEMLEWMDYIEKVGYTFSRSETLRFALIMLLINPNINPHSYFFSFFDRPDARITSHKPEEKKLFSLSFKMDINLDKRVSESMEFYKTTRSHLIRVALDYAIPFFLHPSDKNMVEHYPIIVSDKL